MTDKQLDKLGIHKDGPKRLFPNRYWCNATQSNINIHRQDPPEGVVEIIFEEGVRQGRIEGKITRSEQIRGILHNTDIKI